MRVLDDKDDDDVGGDVGAGDSVVIFSVGDGGAHSVGGVIIVAFVVVAAAALLSLLLSYSFSSLFATVVIRLRSVSGGFRAKDDGDGRRGVVVLLLWLSVISR